jgi:hypothetical protein
MHILNPLEFFSKRTSICSASLVKENINLLGAAASSSGWRNCWKMDSFRKGSSRHLFLFQLLVGGQGVGSSVQDSYNLKLASETFTKFNSVRFRTVHHFHIGQLPQSKEALIIFTPAICFCSFIGSSNQVPKKESIILVLAMHILDPL